jgi:phosphoribosylformylglycinamidine synthase
MKARVTVTLKSGVLDPQGKAIEGALASLGIAGVTSVRQGKLFDVELDGADQAAAEAALGQACEKLLANTVIETYRIEMQPGQAAVAPAQTPAEDAATEGPASPAAVDPAAATDIAARDTDMPTEGHP